MAELESGSSDSADHALARAKPKYSSEGWAQSKQKTAHLRKRIGDGGNK
jgi:hypothetical protein